MIKCQACTTDNQDNAQYCDECGSRLNSHRQESAKQIDAPKFQTSIADSPIFKSAKFTSIGISPIDLDLSKQGNPIENNGTANTKNLKAKLVIERGKAVGTEFTLISGESYVGRWDADNGIFPEIDLDKYDSEAKVSRRHARITYAEGKFSIEDLGSTNGTFINRGRRLIPGIAQTIKDGDEIIVGKTFLRLYIES